MSIRDFLQNHKNISSTITRHLTLICIPYTSFFQCMKAYRNPDSHIFILAPALKYVYTTQTEAKDVQRENERLISVADRNIRGANCGESSHGDVVLGPLEIRAHVESRHHTYTHKESNCENKTGDKGPFKT